jgi:UDP-N-acetylglucosamine:LPS N-acetylglucosamine transferase
VLADAVSGLAGDRERLATMARASAALARPDAAERIARDLLRLAGARGSEGENRVS